MNCAKIVVLQVERLRQRLEGRKAGPELRPKHSTWIAAAGI